MQYHLVSIFFLLTCSLVFAREQGKLLALDPHWKKLLHFSPRLFGPARSDIISKDFFLAPNGASDPEAELAATVEGLTNTPEVYCRFPARRMWLESHGYSFAKRDCPEFEQWTRGHGVRSVSLIFASGFLGNPASFFGHPLLKFNFKDERSPLDLLDTAINYGAFTPPDVGPLPYAIKGIFGGYEAGFTSVDFFFHKNNYSELELRDMWEYELALSAQQVNELVAHVWELTDAKIPYYFLSDNCAYRMGDLLELVVERQLNPRGVPYSIPSTLFHKLHDYGLVKEVKLIKSRQTRLREKVLSLNNLEHTELRLITEDINNLSSDSYNELDTNQRSRVLESAMDYFSYRQVLDEKGTAKEHKRRVLQARLALPPKVQEWQSQSQRPPHESQKPVLTQLGGFHSERFGRGASLRIRPVFYDLVSPDSGRPALSSLGLFDLEINATEEQVWLKTFNLISVENLNISKTGLYGDGGYAWRFKVGADQINLACNKCVVPRIEAGIGKAIEVSRSLVFYGMLDQRVQSNYQGSGFLSATPSFAALISVSEDIRFHASAGRRFYLEEVKSAENIYDVETRIGSHRSWDVRLRFQEHEDRRYGLALGRYW